MENTTKTKKLKYEDLNINELINLLTIIVDEKSKIFRFHPNNPKGVSIEAEYSSLSTDIETITNLIAKKNSSSPAIESIIKS